MGNLSIADSGNRRIRKVDICVCTGILECPIRRLYR